LRPSGGSGPHYLFSTRPIAAALPGRTNPAKDKAFTVPMLPASRGKSRMHKAIAPANLRVMLHLVFGGRAQHGKCSIYQPIGAFVFPSNFGGDPAGRVPAAEATAGGFISLSQQNSCRRGWKVLDGYCREPRDRTSRIEIDSVRRGLA
jgi:hypothetical protein